MVAADEFKTPAISYFAPDWSAALTQLKGEIASQPAAADKFGFDSDRNADADRTTAISQINAITSKVFPGVEQSPVPVLLPFDSGMYEAERNGGVPDSISVSHYQAGFRPVSMFNAGPSGYDALFALDPGAGDNMPSRVYAKPVEVQITGSMLVYDIDDTRAAKGETVKSLAEDFPDLRRTIREGYVRYAFTRFGVPYVVYIQCLDSSARARRLSCREASPVAERFIKSLRFAGGTPIKTPDNIAARSSDRPSTFSPDFTYHRPGNIIANSGYRGQSGVTDYTVYARIRFPIERAPAFANSQSFMNWGDCYRTGRVSWSSTKGDEYHCKRNDKPLVFDESAKANYSYPWQDNFCETRDFDVGQCPSGMGHQGQDIRPSSCQMRNAEADRCLPDIFPTVAVRDGVLIRTPTQQAVYLLVNAPGEHIRFRYIHMNPANLDADGVVHGRRVTEGEEIGVVSNYQDRVGGTTSHLHFDTQVFTRDGWLWVNPYTTLISSYERLIGGRGREYEPPPLLAPVAHAIPLETATPAGTSGSGDQ
ncbi:MAG: M23 family peptidase [Afipia sp.]|nr:M23 family peptidase [Afipia sp.]